MKTNGGYLFRSCYIKEISSHHSCEKGNEQTFFWRKGRALGALWLTVASVGEPGGRLTRSKLSYVIGLGSIFGFFCWSLVASSAKKKEAGSHCPGPNYSGLISSEAELWPPELVTTEVTILLSELAAPKIVRVLFSFRCSVSHSQD